MKTRTMQMDDIGREDAPPGSRDWCSRVRLQIAMRLYEAKSTVSQVRFSLKSMRDERHFTKLQDRHGRDFETWEAFCSSPRPWGLEIPPEVADQIIAEPDDGRRVGEMIEMMRGAVPLAGHGEIGNGRGRVDDVKSTQGGNSAPYLAARLKRDHPEIAAAVERGEYRSMRAAAKAAGIVKPQDPVRIIQNAWGKADPDQRAAIVNWIADQQALGLLPSPSS